MIEIKTFYRLISLILCLFFLSGATFIFYELLFSELQLGECYKVFIPTVFWALFFLFVSITGKWPKIMAFRFLKKV
ncbi:hypothetical protein DESC_460168 [Desulfosarcina cetonica]|nr:hypothetical protein DESC_460168 [Desulfosarcina cetonica]